MSPSQKSLTASATSRSLSWIWLEQVAIGAALCGAHLPRTILAQLDELPARRQQSSRPGTREHTRKPKGSAVL